MRGTDSFYSIAEKENLQIVATGTDIWDGPTSNITIPPSAGEQMQLVCADGDDTAGGIGIREVSIHYLDSNGDEQTVNQATNGSTADLPPLDIRFIQSMHAIDVGSNGVGVGQISVRSKNIIGNPVYQTIKAGGNMSLCINKMVPRNKTFYLTQWYGSASGKQPVTLRLRSSDHEQTLYENPYVFLFKDTASLENASFARSWNIEEAHVKIPELSIIKVSAWTSQAGATVSTGFSGTLKDNT